MKFYKIWKEERQLHTLDSCIFSYRLNVVIFPKGTQFIFQDKCVIFDDCNDFQNREEPLMFLRNLDFNESDVYILLGWGFAHWGWDSFILFANCCWWPTDNFLKNNGLSSSTPIGGYYGSELFAAPSQWVRYRLVLKSSRSYARNYNSFSIFKTVISLILHLLNRITRRQ